MNMNVYIVLKALVDAQIKTTESVSAMFDCVCQQAVPCSAAKTRMINRVCELAEHLPRLAECEEMLNQVSEKEEDK